MKRRGGRTIVHTRFVAAVFMAASKKKKGSLVAWLAAASRVTAPRFQSRRHEGDGRGSTAARLGPSVEARM